MVYHCVFNKFILLLIHFSLTLSPCFFLTAQHIQAAPKPVPQLPCKVSGPDAMIKIQQLKFVPPVFQRNHFCTPQHVYVSWNVANGQSLLSWKYQIKPVIFQLSCFSFLFLEFFPFKTFIGQSSPFFPVHNSTDLQWSDTKFLPSKHAPYSTHPPTQT